MKTSQLTACLTTHFAQNGFSQDKAAMLAKQMTAEIAETTRRLRTERAALEKMRDRIFNDLMTK